MGVPGSFRAWLNIGDVDDGLFPCNISDIGSYEFRPFDRLILGY
jgi:hypothetical protein